MAQCPLGFGSGAVRSSPVECGLCRGILFDPVRLEPCMCSYCNDCGARVKECLKCGRDVESMVEDPELENQVRIFVQAHKVPDGHKPLGLFYLEHAMKHKAHKNNFAADARLAEAIQELDKGAAWEEKAVAMSTQATLRGQDFRDVESAVELFDASIKLLEDKCAESHMTIAIAKTKYAVYEHGRGNLADAEELYTSALSSRREAKEHGECGLESVASSLLGLASVQSDRKQTSAARCSYEAVVQLLGDTSVTEKGKSILTAAEGALHDMQ